MADFPNMTVTEESGAFDGEGPEATFAKVVTNGPDGRETVVFVYWTTGDVEGVRPYLMVDIDGPAPTKVVQNDYTIADLPEEYEEQELPVNPCVECGEEIKEDDVHAGYDDAGRAMCGSCIHNATRSGWNPGDPV